ncbi:hypothetical protein BDQ12DRAFT_600554 [Crucibulum laeve]|uniref:Large ribosomal subunit protein bL32m n=1 Tax=Crucibulum laeve TaxID=68775 RepID=A0A5C3M6T6_9AGAR|nr:hypothetical protein BDQ12DRAFT_600554 [Crucibulum laeve]
MASLALQRSRTTLFPLFRLPALTSFIPPTFLSVALAFPQLTRWSIPSLQSLLELFPPVVLAVPKSKVSHSRKAMRSANKGLKDKHNIVNCPGCGSPKLAHHLCSNCYNFLNRAWKSKQKQAGGEIPDMS